MRNYGEDNGVIAERNDEIGFLQYAAKVFPAITVLVAVAFLAHGSILFTERIGIDTEYIMFGKADFLNMGRQGLVWLAKILGTGTTVSADSSGAVNNVLWTGAAGNALKFNPYLVQVLTFAFLAAAPVGFGYLFCRYSGQKTVLNMTLIVFGVSYIVSPFWVSQVYFFNQSAQVTFACVLTAAAIYFAEEGRRAFKRKWYGILLAVFLMQLTFSSYQVLILMYAAGVVMVFLSSELKEPRNAKRQLLWILPHMGIFFAGFAIYWMVTKRYFYSMEDYLKQQLAWDDGFKAGMSQGFAAAVGMLRKTPPYYTGFYGLFFLFCLAAVAYVCIRSGRFCWRIGAGILFFLALVVLALSAFAFTFFFGGEAPPRVQLILPFVQGCLLYLGVAFLFGVERRQTAITKALRKAVVILLTVVVLKNTLADMGTCGRMYYRDEWRYQYDKQMAHDISVTMKDYLAQNSFDPSYMEKVIFLGYPEPPYNPSAQMELREDDVIGRSIFSYDLEVLDIRRPRILDFMRSAGYPLDPEPEVYSDGATRAYFYYFEHHFGKQVDAMPVFPARGSVRFLESEDGLKYFVVKLDSDWRGAFHTQRELWKQKDAEWPAEEIPIE